jgi:hypothetical protein
MVKMGSPSKDLDALKHSHKLLNSVKQNPIIHNNIRGLDQNYDEMWEDTINGRAFNKKTNHEK